MPAARGSKTFEEELRRAAREVLTPLLLDRSSGKRLLWGTADYAGHAPDEEMSEEAIGGPNEGLIRPRVLKAVEVQRARARARAEVFTPAWVCNAQNNLIDAAWFGRPGVFNTQAPEARQWQTTPGEIVFPEGKTWRQYVRLRRLEICCGEAPYLTSRYDVTTQEPIPVPDRIGMLDRKLRVCAQACRTRRAWVQAALEAVKACYGFDWQGDNVLLARKNLLFAVIEAQQVYFPAFAPLTHAELLRFAEVLSWNIWQMDGLRGVVPGSCHEEVVAADLFGEGYAQTRPCAGCQSGDIRQHNGIPCLVKDWFARDAYARPTPFYKLFKEAFRCP